MKGSRQISLTSQLVLLVSIAIVVMQVYKFFISGEILDLFNTLASMVLGAYFQKSTMAEHNANTDTTTITSTTTPKDLQVVDTDEMQNLSPQD